MHSIICDSNMKSRSITRIKIELIYCKAYQFITMLSRFRKHMRLQELILFFSWHLANVALDIESCIVNIAATCFPIMSKGN